MFFFIIEATLLFYLPLPDLIKLFPLIGKNDSAPWPLSAFYKLFLDGEF